MERLNRHICSAGEAMGEDAATLPTMVLFTGVFMVGVDVAMTGIAVGGRS